MKSNPRDTNQLPAVHVTYGDDILTEAQPTATFRARLDSFAYSTLPTTSSHKLNTSTMPTTRRGRSTPTVKVEPNTTTRRSSRKRASDDEGSEHEVSHPPAKKKRSTTKERSSTDPRNPVNNLVDSLRPRLMLVFIGLNPGLMTASTGHAYAHPSNLFWKLLHSSGVTTKRHLPSETRDLMDLYSIGNTNICARPTRSGDGLSKEELVEGAGILEEKIANFRPEAVCIVGKGIWDVIYKTKTGKQLKSPDFNYGWQDEELWLGRSFNDDGTLEWAGARTFVATTTSGLAAGMRPQEKLEIWQPLGEWLQQKRGVKQEEEVKIEEE